MGPATRHGALASVRKEHTFALTAPGGHSGQRLARVLHSLVRVSRRVQWVTLESQRPTARIVTARPHTSNRAQPTLQAVQATTGQHTDAVQPYGPAPPRRKVATLLGLPRAAHQGASTEAGGAPANCPRGTPTRRIRPALTRHRHPCSKSPAGRIPAAAFHPEGSQTATRAGPPRHLSAPAPHSGPWASPAAVSRTV